MVTKLTTAKRIDAYCKWVMNYEFLCAHNFELLSIQVTSIREVIPDVIDLDFFSIKATAECNHFIYETDDYAKYTLDDMGGESFSESFFNEYGE